MGALAAAAFVVGPVDPLLAAPLEPATQVEIVGGVGSEKFGEDVLVLSNGNFVVVDSRHDMGAVVDVGAVHLYNGTLAGNQTARWRRHGTGHAREARNAD